MHKDWVREKRTRNYLQKQVRSDPRFKTKAHKPKLPDLDKDISVRNWELNEGN